MLKLDHLTLSRGTRIICQDLTVDLGKGECLVIEGSNGSGKSTLMECLMGKRVPSQGQVLLDEHNLHHLGRAEQKLFLNSTGTVLQHNTLRPLDSVAKGLSSHSPSNEELQKMLRGLQFEKRGYEMISELSFAEQRRLDLGRSLIHKPRLLIWDEPFLGLDPFWKGIFLKAARELQQLGTAVILSTVQPDDVLSLEGIKRITL